jgi:hypothetical protein
MEGPKLGNEARDQIANLYLEPLFTKAATEACQETAETFCKSKCGRIPDKNKRETFCFMAIIIFKQRYECILKRRYQLN